VIFLDSRSKALLFAHSAKEKKATDIVVLDMRKLSNITDYFVICSGENYKQIQAIAEKVGEDLSKAGESYWSKEGLCESGWVLVDSGDIIGHIFMPEVREFYDLESLWADVPLVNPD